tara:strand:+ start:19433 stop:21637 length:2205 start_codon:yes stop_codon:yes gene_type:complete
MPRIFIKLLSFLVLFAGQFVMAQSYDADGSLKNAEYLLKQNRNYEAREILQSIVNVNSDNPKANTLLGKSYLAENDYANALKYFKVAYQFGEKTTIENLILFAQTAKQNGDYQLAQDIATDASTKIYITGPDRALLRNIKTSINEVRNGSFKEHVNELSQFANNSSGSELAPYPITDKKFSFSKSTKSEGGLTVESFVSDAETLTQIEINPAYGNVTNIQFYNEIAYLTICKDGLCNLYSANYNKNYRLKNVAPIKELNLEGYSTTQAFVFKLKNTDMMLFSSNRPSLSGGFDIYLSYRMRTEWSAPKLLPKTINTPGNEITPFYRGNQFYFSSDYHPSLGGFDIFSATTTTFIDFKDVENLGTPFNSVANDLYFKIYPEGKQGLLSSNRLGSIEGSSATCCNDIYQFPWPPKLLEIKKEKTTLTQEESETAYYNNLIDELKAILPLTLYFHNDIPLPNKTVPTYSQTYFPYKRMDTEYIRENYSTDNTNFFNNTLPFEYSKLQVFTSLIQEIFKSDLNIEFTIKGFASPLASKNYNDALSQRRINSFINELFAYKAGLFEAYRSNISINQLPFGETKSATGVSDDKSDPRNSIYAFEALRERKIEIINIAIKNDNNVIQLESNTNDTRANFNSKVDSVLVRTESESSYSITEDGFRTDTIVITNPYSEEFTIDSIEASCGCTEIDAQDSTIAGNGSIKIFAKRELFYGSVKPVTLRFISTHPEKQSSFIIPLD